MLYSSQPHQIQSLANFKSSCGTKKKFQLGQTKSNEKIGFFRLIKHSRPRPASRGRSQFAEKKKHEKNSKQGATFVLSTHWWWRNHALLWCLVPPLSLGCHYALRVTRTTVVALFFLEMQSFWRIKIKGFSNVNRKLNPRLNPHFLMIQSNVDWIEKWQDDWIFVKIIWINYNFYLSLFWLFEKSEIFYE